MKKIFLMVVLFALFSCKQEPPKPKTAEELKRELAFQERLNPTQYISVSNITMAENKIQTQKPGLFRSSKYKIDGSIITGVIKNSATIAKFKDVVLTVTFMSQTGTVIEQNDYVFYEFYNPNSMNSFNLKVYQPQATNQFNVTVKSAIAIN